MNIEAMKALCEPSRCKIIMLLSERAYCVSALATLLGLSAPAVSQHLRVLYDAGLVTSEKYGYHTHYKLNKDALLSLSKKIAELTEEKPDICHTTQGNKCSAADTVGCRTREKKGKGDNNA
ncbi:MAG: winged helix-turn-helix transcriptional regulator [Ruminococcaceae bacterium]|nr:winged helix-turn-helix transcriptional regulator [Oscillospiraceae bacterium]